MSVAIYHFVGGYFCDKIISSCFQKMSVYELGDEFDETAMSLSLIESGFRHTGNASETSSQVDINDL